jgi:hypothetical protein
VSRASPGGYSQQEAALLRLREKALKGDARSLDRLLELARLFNSTIDSTPGSDAMRTKLSSPPIARMFWPRSSIAAKFDDIKESGSNNDG